MRGITISFIEKDTEIAELKAKLAKYQAVTKN
jgi:hypothetical protein